MRLIISLLRYNSTLYIISRLLADNLQVAECRVYLNPTLSLHLVFIYANFKKGNNVGQM